MPTIDTGPLACDLRIYCGDLNRIDLELIADDPVDLIGAVITAQARTTAPSPEVALTAEVIPNAQPELGRFSLSWADEDAQRALLGTALEWKGTWDVQVQLADETKPRSLLRGVFVLVHDVTRNEGVAP